MVCRTSPHSARPSPVFFALLRVDLCQQFRKGEGEPGAAVPIQQDFCGTSRKPSSMSGKRTLSLSAYKKSKEALAVAPAKRLGFGESVSTREVRASYRQYSCKRVQ